MTNDIASFRQLAQTVAAMQAAAEEDDWDKFLLLQQLCLQILSALPAPDSVTVAEPERTELVLLLQNVRASLDIALPLAQKQKAFLASELTGIHNTDKLNRAYL